jgi:hypothetical protein
MVQERQTLMPRVTIVVTAELPSGLSRWAFRDYVEREVRAVCGDSITAELMPRDPETLLQDLSRGERSRRWRAWFGQSA